MTNELLLYNLSKDPFENFKNWYEEATILEDNADVMTLSTIDSDRKRPVLRTVLYKGLKGDKFSFYTNYLSNKSIHIGKNSEVSLLFYWMRSQHQIRVQGRVKKMLEEDSRAYFRSRDFESQIVSLVSNQSYPIESKSELVTKVEALKIEYQNKEVPMPLNWGGFLVDVYEFEFFIYGRNRLNDRFLFEKDVLENWKIMRLQP